MKAVESGSKVFRKYIAENCPLRSQRPEAWRRLEVFAEKFGFKIVDRYYTHDPEQKAHVPAIEVF